MGSFGHNFGISLGITLGSLWDHFGIILGSFWDHFGITLGSFWDTFGIILGSFWDHFWIMLGSFWDHFGIILGSFWNHFGLGDSIPLINFAPLELRCKINLGVKIDFFRLRGIKVQNHLGGVIIRNYGLRWRQVKGFLYELVLVCAKRIYRCAGIHVAGTRATLRLRKAIFA